MRELSMKKLYIALLCILFAGLYACNTVSEKTKKATTTVATEKISQETNTEGTPRKANVSSTVEIKTNMSDPYSYIAKEYYDVFKANIYAHAQRYTLYDIDSNGTEELLLGGENYSGRQLYAVYTIQNGVAVQQKQFTDPLISSDVTSHQFSLFSNGYIKVALQGIPGIAIKYYQFENGELVLKTRLLGIGDSDYDIEYRHDINENGNWQSKSITEEEFEQMQKEIEGDGQTVELDWRPLAEWGK